LTHGCNSGELSGPIPKKRLNGPAWPLRFFKSNVIDLARNGVPPYVLGHGPDPKGRVSAEREPAFPRDKRAAFARKSCQTKKSDHDPIQSNRIMIRCRNFERIFMPTVPPTVLPVLMLFASNVFMTFAWYGHLRFKDSWLPSVILVSWGIAFFEYWLAVPANRWGSAVYSAAQLKTMQEVITLIVFAGFSVLYLKEPLGWNHGLGFALIALGAFFIFHKWS
jgi:uncharacterized protein (DUF486 family)